MESSFSRDSIVWPFSLRRQKQKKLVKKERSLIQSKDFRTNDRAFTQGLTVGDGRLFESIG